MNSRLGSFEYYGSAMGPFPNDFKTDFVSDFQSLYRNWGTKGKKKRRQLSGNGPWQTDFPVCKSEGGNYNCPAEYVKEFSGLGDLTETLKNPMVTLGAGLVAGWLLCRYEIFNWAVEQLLTT